MIVTRQFIVGGKAFIMMLPRCGRPYQLYHVTNSSCLDYRHKVMEDFQTGEETSFAVDEVSGIIKDVSNAKDLSCLVV